MLTRLICVRHENLVVERACCLGGGDLISFTELVNHGIYSCLRL